MGAVAGGLAAGVTDVGDLEMLADLGLALALSSLIGLERELQAKSAGMRTHTLVGVGAALFMLVSKFGFADVVTTGLVQLDPSRVAAQVVSGIGFVGGGLIFVRRDVVRGLTTAASVWLVAAVGMAAGAGLVLVAVAATAAYFVVVLGYAPLERLIYRTNGGLRRVQVTYLDGHGVLRTALEQCTTDGFAVVDLRVEREDTSPDGERLAVVSLRVRGKRPLTSLVADLARMEGVMQVSAQVSGTEGDDPEPA